jgi:hypothetical protein
MLLDSKTLEQIAAEDILSLIPDVQENRRLDYKQALPENNERGARDFLTDVCAMANSAGGYLVYGVEEERDEDNKQTGVPKSVCGVGEVNEDAARLMWQQRIAQNIEPTLIGHRVGFVGGFEGGKRVMVVYVQKSLFAPHRINYQGKKEFYVRHDAGNMPMDIGEIRHAFVEAKQVPQRIDELRRLRVSQILADETPVELLRDCAVFVAHAIPLSSFAEDAVVDVTAIKQNSMPALAVGTDHRRLNADGYLFHLSQNNDAVRGYVQVFRTGVIEMCATMSDQPRPDQHGIVSLSSGWLEKGFIEFTHASLALLRDLGVQPPVYYGLALMRIKGAAMYRPERFWRSETELIDRDVLMIPTVTSETLTEDAGALIHPALDAIWQASGMVGSPNYNDEGLWAPR